MIKTIIIGYIGVGKSQLSKRAPLNVIDLDYGFIRDKYPDKSLNVYNKGIEDFINNKMDITKKILLINDPYAITEGNYMLSKKVRIIMVLPSMSVWQSYVRRINIRAKINRKHHIEFANTFKQHPEWIRNWEQIAKNNNIRVIYLTDVLPTLTYLLYQDRISNDINKRYLIPDSTINK